MSREKLVWKKKRTQTTKASIFTNHQIHLCLFKLGYDMLALLSGVMYILSGENLAGVYSTTRRLRDQNTTQVDDRQGRAGTLYVWLLHLPPCTEHRTFKREHNNGRWQIFFAVILFGSCPPRHHSWYSHNVSPFPSLLLLDQVHVCLNLLARGRAWTKSYDRKTNKAFFPFIVPCIHAISLIQPFFSGISNSLHRNS